MDEEEHKNNCKGKAQYKCKSGTLLLFRAVLGFSSAGPLWWSFPNCLIFFSKSVDSLLCIFVLHKVSLMEIPLMPTNILGISGCLGGANIYLEWGEAGFKRKEKLNLLIPLSTVNNQSKKTPKYAMGNQKSWKKNLVLYMIYLIIIWTSWVESTSKNFYLFNDFF